jgi:hypothetical protein
MAQFASGDTVVAKPPVGAQETDISVLGHRLMDEYVVSQAKKSESAGTPTFKNDFSRQERDVAAKPAESAKPSAPANPSVLVDREESRYVKDGTIPRLSISGDKQWEDFQKTMKALRVEESLPDKKQTFKDFLAVLQLYGSSDKGSVLSYADLKALSNMKGWNDKETNMLGVMTKHYDTLANLAHKELFRWGINKEDIDASFSDDLAEKQAARVGSKVATVTSLIGYSATREFGGAGAALSSVGGMAGGAIGYKVGEMAGRYYYNKRTGPEISAYRHEIETALEPK